MGLFHLGTTRSQWRTQKQMRPVSKTIRKSQVDIKSRFMWCLTPCFTNSAAYILYCFYIQNKVLSCFLWCQLIPHLFKWVCPCLFFPSFIFLLQGRQRIFEVMALGGIGEGMWSEAQVNFYSDSVHYKKTYSLRGCISISCYVDLTTIMKSSQNVINSS